MKVGDLITKTQGYGCESGWVGIVLGHKEPKKVTVLTNDGIEHWIQKFCEVISEIN